MKPLFRGSLRESAEKHVKNIKPQKRYIFSEMSLKRGFERHS